MSSDETPLNERETLENMLYDTMSLHRQACLGYATKVPNLTDGGLDSITFQDFAHMIEPILQCPSCGTISQHGDDSLVFLSASMQCSFLCTMCWEHNPIPAFGIHNPEDKR